MTALRLRLAVATLLRTALSILAVVLVRNLLTGPGDDALVLVGWAGLLLAAQLGASLAGYDQELSQQRLAARIELGILGRLLERLNGLPVPRLEAGSRGDLVQTLRDDVAQVRAARAARAALALDGVLVLGLTSVALWLSPALTGIALPLLALAGFPVAWAARRAPQGSRSVRERAVGLLDGLLERLHGARPLRLLRGEAAAGERVIASARAYFEELLGLVRVRARGRLGLDAAAGASLVAVVIGGALRVRSGALAWSELLAFLVALRALHAPLHAMASNALLVLRHAAAERRVAALLAEPGLPAPREAVAVAERPARLTCEGVGHAYGEAPVLAGVAFELRSGETLGVVGPSGAGKSTLLGLLARLDDPRHGAVRLDGVDLRRLAPDELRRRVSLVTQDPFVFAASVRDNVACGRPGASDAEVERVCRSTGLHDEVTRLPDGYATRLGAGGHGLSRGQAQRLALARALLAEAPILLLDEATASLDAGAEARLHEALAASGSAMRVIVTHRLPALRQADRILVLEAGRVVACAPHARLLRECPLYRRMWRARPGSSAPSAPSRAPVRAGTRSARVPGAPAPR